VVVVVAARPDPLVGGRYLFVEPFQGVPGDTGCGIGRSGRAAADRRAVGSGGRDVTGLPRGRLGLINYECIPSYCT
jgi:hypothetical protein